MKWKTARYNAPFHQWTPPELVYPCESSEKDALHALKNAFDPLPLYREMEVAAIKQNTVVTLDIPLPDGQIAFLENTAEKCTSPQTKHSQEGMRGARHWVQRVDTPEGMFRRLTDGYGVSLMFGERYHQYIRNSNNWRGINGVQLDLDVWHQQLDALKKKLEAEDRDADFIAEQLDANEKLPLPVYSQSELFDRYPLLPRICSYLIPSASSLYDGRPFKARGIVLFSQPMTDQRIYRAFGDILCGEFDCIPANVTKNPVAVGFGNTHNAPQAYRNDSPDTDYIAEKIELATSNEISTTKQRNREQKKKAERKAHYNTQGRGTGGGENISAFIDKCNAVSEMVKAGWLTPGRGNEYRWHESESDRSCDIRDGVIHIFSHSMSAASPAAELEPVNAHRFYLYQLTGLDLAKDSDKAQCREYLFDRGYGSDPKVFRKNQQKAGIRKPVKLKKNVVSVITETLDKSREFLKGVFADKRIKFFGLRADTGVGKNEAAISFFLRGFSGLVNVPTKKLAKEMYARLDKAEIDAFRYRGILSNPDGAFPDESPCIHDVRYDAIASRGWNAFFFLCEQPCEVRELCEKQGYRSQAEQAHEAQVTVMPFPDIFLNPAFRSLAKEFLPTYSDDLILHDEFDPYNAFLEIEVPKSRLHQMRDDWEGYDASYFAKEILRILEVDGNLSELRALVMGLTASERDAILDGLTCVMWRGQVLSREEAHRCHEFIAKIHNTEQILTLPRLETDDWNLIVQLELFFERYPRDADMPMKYENNTLTFLLPPLPMKTRARMGFMSATLDENLFRRTFSTRQEKRADVAFHDTGLTAWHPEARLYQLRTNRNPRRTVYQAKGERDESLLSSTGADYWDLISDDLKNENRGLITYDALLDEKASELEGIQTANFGGLVGLDIHFKNVGVLHILFSPEIPPGAVDFKAKALFGDDTEPISYERDDNGQYIDRRLQVSYDSGVISEIIQGIGRGRPVSCDVTIVVWCSHYLPGITDREQTRLFDENDWREAGGIQGLNTAINNREAFEALTAELTAENTIAEFQSVYGCTYEYARQLWHEAGGKAHKDDTDAELVKSVLEMKAQGIGERKIATELGISYGKVRSIIKEHGVH